MKIALLSEKYTPDIGGLAISAARLGGLLVSAGHRVHVFGPTTNLPSSETRTLESGEITVTRFGVRKRVDDTLVDWFELIVQEHRREPFDLLHAYFLPQAGFVAAYSGKYLNVPSVVSIRGNDIERAAFDPAKFSHIMFALQNASSLTTNASLLAAKAGALVDRRINIIPNGIDIESFKPLEKNLTLAAALNLQRKGANEEFVTSPVIGFAGELREKTGLQNILRAYAQLNKRQCVTLLIVGEVRAGDDTRAFEELREAMPNSQVVVTGLVPHSEMPAYYALMDIFVHPSLRDGMPNALLEAMACEQAVIATPVGGITDVIEDGKNGILVPVDDPDRLAESIFDLLSQPVNREALAKSARETVVSRFTVQKELQANLEVYRHLGLKI